MKLTELEKALLDALLGLRGSNNGMEADWCGEMPHEEDCQAALDAVALARKHLGCSPQVGHTWKGIQMTREGFDRECVKCGEKRDSQ